VKLIVQNQDLASSSSSSRSQAAARLAPLRGGLRDSIQRLYAEEAGFSTFWRGNGTNVLRVLPTYGTRFWLYHRCENALPASLANGDVRRLCAGALAGSGALLLTHPLDTVRTRLAASRLHVGRGAYTGPSDCLRFTWRHEGVRGLYAGCLISLLEIAPYTAICFASYEGAKHRFSEQSGGSSVVGKLMSGLLGGVLASTFCYPLDTVRRQLMLEGSKGFDARYQRSGLSCIAQLWRAGGAIRFYRGWSITLCKSVPTVAITFVVNDFLQESLRPLQRWRGGERI